MKHRAQLITVFNKIELFSHNIVHSNLTTFVNEEDEIKEVSL